MKKWTKEEDQKLKKIVNQNLSYKDIGKLLNRSAASCHCRALKHLGLNNKYIYRKYLCNEDFWSVPNHLNSYWAGFSMADACIYKSGVNSKRSNSYVLRLAIKDYQHLLLLKNQMKFTGPIKIIKQDSHKCCKISVSRIKIIQDLEKNFNIIPRKTNRLSPPNLNKFLTYCYLIGYTDGDGCIMLKKMRKNKKKLSIVFCSNSKQILHWIDDLMNKDFEKCALRFNKKRKIGKVKNKKAFTYTIYGLRACVLFDFLSKLPVPKLARKWSNPEILDYVAEQKQKHPHLFKLAPAPETLETCLN